MIVSPDRPCEQCKSILFDLTEDGRECLKCGLFVAEFSLEEQCPGITAKIIKARIDEERGEEGEIFINNV